MGKTQKAKQKHYQINVIYDGAKSKNKICPKCGAGVFMANHKNRWSCGKCGYTEFKK